MVEFTKLSLFHVFLGICNKFLQWYMRRCWLYIFFSFWPQQPQQVQQSVLVPTVDAEGHPVAEILQICNWNIAYGILSVYYNVKS